ncbi:MAG: hypothetical protein HYX68_25960 [Planctomycetes bacterium]|nr:hypothetical protein [Planctomycetota bacterium]
MMFAQTFLDMGIPDGVLHLVRIIAAVGGAVVGWFVFDPLTRLLYRVSFKGATPTTLLLGSKATGAATLSLLIYFFIPLGGSGGLGFGAGPGGGAGKGPGQGGDSKVARDGKGDKKINDAKKNDATPSTKKIESVEIEIIGRDDDDGSEHYYLLKRKKPALTAAELADYFKKNREHIEVIPVLTRNSIGEAQENSPISQLIALTKKYDVKRLATKGP